MMNELNQIFHKNHIVKQEKFNIKTVHDYQIINTGNKYSNTDFEVRRLNNV